MNQQAPLPPPAQPARTPRRQRSAFLPRLALVVVVFGLLSCACLFMLTRLLAVRIPMQSAERAPNLNPLEVVYLEVYLGLHSDNLERRSLPGAQPITFEVEAGSNASTIASALVHYGLIEDATLFRNYARYTGLDSQLEAGRFELSAAMTIPEIAQALTQALSPDVTLQVIEGWRMEQIAEAIDRAGLEFTGAEFLALVGPGAVRPPQFDFLASLPADASLEGFLFPDTYRLAPDATTADLRDLMLENFYSMMTPQLLADAEATGLNLYEIVTLASVVEREAVISEERPMIAGVYLNRLAVDMKLDADPTVQYALGYDASTGEWWPPLTVDDYSETISPYNTYLNAGLPPGPIANPGLSSIVAVIHPAESDYLFFRACDSGGSHVFSLTFSEHEQACD